MDKNLTLGDLCKVYEEIESRRKLMPGVPVMARLDGKAFHTFTKGLERPFDSRLSGLMIDTTKYLIDKTQAKIGYTQSDEISLFWFEPDIKSQTYFDGRIQKLCSVLAGMASAKFTKELPHRIPERSDSVVCFDCRVWQVPSLKEVIMTFVWREDDATKNSISMAAEHYYSHNELMNKNSSEKQEMLWQKGVNWNNYPDFFKRGSYVKKFTELRDVTEEDLNRIPEAFRPSFLYRSVVKDFYMPPIRRVCNLEEVLMEDTLPSEREKNESTNTSISNLSSGM